MRCFNGMVYKTYKLMDYKIISSFLIIVAHVFTGCSATRTNTVILTQQIQLPPEKSDVINRHYSHLVAVQDDIIRDYKIAHYTQEYVLKDTVRLGNTVPIFNWNLSVVGACVNLNYSLFTSKNDDINEEMSISGLVAHELAHAQHYSRFSKIELIRLGLRYESYDKLLSNYKLAPWIRSYERFTDLQAIAYGYANELIEQKRRTLQYIKEHELGEDQFYEFSAYLTPKEILLLSQDRELFTKKLEEELAVLKWSSFYEIAEEFPLDVTFSFK